MRTLIRHREVGAISAAIRATRGISEADESGGGRL
jgi:hypothetical protein